MVVGKLETGLPTILLLTLRHFLLKTSPPLLVSSRQHYCLISTHTLSNQH